MRTVSLWINVTLAVIALCCDAASAQAASGLEPGVHVDPGSPAAKEYSLPLNQARGTGSAPNATSSPQANSEGSLFGAGIKPPGSGGPSSGSRAAANGGGATAGSHGAGSSAGAKSGSSSQPGLPQAVLRAARDQGSSGTDGSTLALLGGAVAILVLGGFGGTVLRHSRRAT
ncbi:MAG TPA: hypothetical protein VGN08_02660 [Solirubrobacteraceae bacterium]|jgi:hypothetical protein